MTNRQQIKVLIVDDEALARLTIRNLLLNDPEIEIIGECRNGTEAVNLLKQQSPDLLFLDIQMPGMNGFEVLAQIAFEEIPVIVFVTAFDEYALQAFDVHAIDYLLKPFTDERFEAALTRAKSQIQLQEVNRLSRSLVAAMVGTTRESEPATTKRTKFLNRFMIRSGGRATFVKAEDVDWIAADDYYIKLNVSGRSHLLRMSLNELEEKLDPEHFLRIHRSTIVNFDRIKELQQNPNGDWVVVLKDGTELKLSRSRRERLEQFLAGG